MPKITKTAKIDASNKLFSVNSELHQLFAKLESGKKDEEDISTIPANIIPKALELGLEGEKLTKEFLPNAVELDYHIHPVTKEQIPGIIPLVKVLQKMNELYKPENDTVIVYADLPPFLNNTVIQWLSNLIHDVGVKLVGATEQIQACSASKIDPEEATTIAKYCSGVLPKVSAATVTNVPLKHKVFNDQKVVQHYPTNIIHQLGIHKVEVSTHTAGENPLVAIEYHDSSPTYADSKTRLKGVTERLKKEGLLCFPQYPNLYCSGEFDKGKLTQLAAFFSLLLNADVAHMGADTIPVVSEAMWDYAGQLALKNGDDTWKSGQGQVSWPAMHNKWLQDKEIMAKSKIYGDLKQLAIHRDQHHELEEAMGVGMGIKAGEKAITDIAANAEKAVALSEKNSWGGHYLNNLKAHIQQFKATGSGSASDAIGNIIHNILMDALQKLGDYGNCPTNISLPDVNAGALSYCEGTLKGTTTILEGGGSQPLHKVAPKQYKLILIDENPEGGYNVFIPIDKGFWSKELADFLESKFGFDCKTVSKGTWKPGQVCGVHIDSHDKIRLLAIFLSNLKGGSEAIGKECVPLAMQEAWNYAQEQAKKGVMAFTQEPLIESSKQWIDKCYKTYGIMPPGLTEEQKVMLKLIGPDKIYAGCDLTAEETVPNMGIIRYCEGVRTNPQAVVSAHLTPQGYLQHFFHAETDKLADIFVNPLEAGKYEVEVKNIDMRDASFTKDVITLLKATNYTCQGNTCAKELDEQEIRKLAMLLSSLHQAYKLPAAQMPKAISLAVEKIAAIPNDKNAYENMVYPYTVEDWKKELGEAPAAPIEGVIQPPVPAGVVYPKLNWQYIQSLPKKGKPPWDVGGCVSFVSAGPTKIKLGYCAGVINEAIDSEGNEIPLGHFAMLTSKENTHQIAGDGAIIFDSKWNTLYITLPDELAEIKPLIVALEKNLHFVHTGETTWHKQASVLSAARVGYFFSQLHNITQLPEDCWGDAVLHALEQVKLDAPLKPVYPFKPEDWMKDVCKIEAPAEEPPQPIDELIEKSTAEWDALSKKIKETPGMLEKAKGTTAYKKMPKPVKDQIHAFLNNQLLIAQKYKTGEPYDKMLDHIQEFVIKTYPGLTKLMVKLQLEIEKKSKIRKGEIPAAPGEIVEKTLEHDSSAELKNEVLNEAKSLYDSGTLDLVQLIPDIQKKFGLGPSAYLNTFVGGWLAGYQKEIDKSNEPVWYHNLPKDMQKLLAQAISEKAAEGKNKATIEQEIMEQFNVHKTNNWQQIVNQEVKAYKSLMEKKKVEEPSNLWEDLPPAEKESLILTAYGWAKDNPEYEKEQIIALFESNYGLQFSPILESLSASIVQFAKAFKEGLIDKAKYTSPWSIEAAGWDDIPIEVAACMGKALNTVKPGTTPGGLYTPLMSLKTPGFTEEEIEEWWKNCVEQYEAGLEKPLGKQVPSPQELKDWLYNWLKENPSSETSPEGMHLILESQSEVYLSPGATAIKAMLDELVQEGEILWEITSGHYLFKEPGKPSKYPELTPAEKQEIKNYMASLIDEGVGKIDAIKKVRTFYNLEIDGLPKLWNEIVAEKVIEKEIPTIEEFEESQPATGEEAQLLAVHLMEQNKFSINEISKALAGKYAIKDDLSLTEWILKVKDHHELKIQVGPKFEELDTEKQKAIIDYIVELSDYSEAEILEFVYGTHGVMYSPALYDEIRKIQKGLEYYEGPALVPWGDLTPMPKQTFAQKVKDENIVGWDELKAAAIQSGIVPDEDMLPSVMELKEMAEEKAEKAAVTYLDYTDLTSETKEKIAKSVANYLDAGMEEANIYKQIAAEYNLSTDEANESMIDGFISGYKIPEIPEEEEPEKLKKYSDLSHKDQLVVTADIKKAKEVGTTKTELVQYLLDAHGIFTDTPLDEFIDSIYEEKEEPEAPSPEQMETYDEMIKAYYQVGWTPAAVMEFFAGKIPADQLKKTANKLYKIYKPEVARITQEYDSISAPLKEHLTGVASKLLNEGKGIADVAWYISVNYGIEKESVKVMVRKVAEKPLEQVEAAVKAMQLLGVGEYIGGCQIEEPMDKLSPQNVSYCQGVLEKKAKISMAGEGIVHKMDSQKVLIGSISELAKWALVLDYETEKNDNWQERIAGVNEQLQGLGLECHPVTATPHIECSVEGKDGMTMPILEQDRVRKAALFLSSIDNVAQLDKQCIPYALKHAMESAKKKNETSKPWSINVYPKEVEDWNTIVCSKILA